MACDNMRIEISEKAVKDLDDMDKATYLNFRKHLAKISKMPPRRHMRHGVPVNVGEVGQCRIAYRVDAENEVMYIIRCFSDHKEYEKWYNSVVY
jgi:mRNA-degrading endonuclease RelE of RelBE toxin-antitoxin system